MIFRKKKKQNPPTYEEFLLLYPVCSEEYRKEYLDVLTEQPRPDRLAGVIVPENLNALSYGQLDDLRNIDKDGDIPMLLAEIIFERPIDLYREDVNKVFGFLNFCTDELKRINTLFASLKAEHSPEEKQAGIEELDFGSFGVLDWYAKRMGITNQNDVRDISWVRIFVCMRNDHAQGEFEKRLQDVYLKKK